MLVVALWFILSKFASGRPALLEIDARWDWAAAIEADIRQVRTCDEAMTMNSEDPKMRVMKALSKTPLTASGIGFIAFPIAKFKTPQAAASTSSKLRRELLSEGLVDFDAKNATYC